MERHYLRPFPAASPLLALVEGMKLNFLLQPWNLHNLRISFVRFAIILNDYFFWNDIVPFCKRRMKIFWIKKGGRKIPINSDREGIRKKLISIVFTRQFSVFERNILEREEEKKKKRF